MCGIDSRRVPSYGLIKNLRADLFACSDISTMMDVVVIDLPPAYGMILSRKWAAGLGGNLMMDLSYLCVPNSDGALIRINRETCYEKHLETFEEGIKKTYGEELLNNAKAHIVEDANEVWKYRQPKSMFLAMEDFDLSLE